MKSRFCRLLITGDEPKRGANDLCGWGASATAQVVSISFRLVTSNQRSTKSVDFIASKFYSKVPRPFFRHHKENGKKRSGYARLGQVHVGFTIDNIVSMVTYPIRRNKLFKMHDRRSQKLIVSVNLYGIIRSSTRNRH